MMLGGAWTRHSLNHKVRAAMLFSLLSDPPDSSRRKSQLTANIRNASHTEDHLFNNWRPGLRPEPWGGGGQFQYHFSGHHFSFISLGFLWRGYFPRRANDTRKSSSK